MRMLALIFGLLLWAGQALAFGTQAGLWLADPMSVRGLGMGGAYAALGADESSINANPSGLAGLRQAGFSASHVFSAFDVGREYLAAAARLGPGVAGLQAGYLYDSQAATGFAGNPLGSFTNSNALLGLAYAMNLGQGIRAGLGLKGIQEDYAGEKLTGFAADLGAQAALPGGWAAAVYALNLGRSNSEAGGYNLPLRLGLGAASPLAFRLARAAVQWEAAPYDAQSRLSLGLEAELPVAAERLASSPVLALRLGYQWALQAAQDQRASAGVGFSLPPHWSLDYAYTQILASDSEQRLALAYHFGGSDIPALVPLAPQGLRLEEGSVLAWEDPNHPACSYNLYCDSGGGARRLNPRPLASPSQKLAIPRQAKKTYRFWVTAVSAGGNESAPSADLVYRPF